MFSMDSYLKHTKNNQMVTAEKSDFARSLNWSTLKLSFQNWSSPPWHYSATYSLQIWIKSGDSVSPFLDINLKIFRLWQPFSIFFNSKVGNSGVHGRRDFRASGVFPKALPTCEHWWERRLAEEFPENVSGVAEREWETEHVELVLHPPRPPLPFRTQAVLAVLVVHAPLFLCTQKHGFVTNQCYM